MNDEITQILKDKAQALNDDLCFTVYIKDVSSDGILLDDNILEVTAMFGLRYEEGDFAIGWRDSYAVGDDKKSMLDVLNRIRCFDMKKFIIEQLSDIPKHDWDPDTEYFSPLSYFIREHFGSVDSWKKKMAINALRQHDTRTDGRDI
jgi:hypothetical protein